MIQFVFSIIFVAVLVTGLVVGYRALLMVGKGFFERVNINLSGHLVPLGVLMLFALWGYISYETFKNVCTTVSRAHVLFAAAKKARGLRN